LYFSPRLVRVRADPLQRKAASIVAGEAISVISGRGGTGNDVINLSSHVGMSHLGKTEVVTSVLEVLSDLRQSKDDDEDFFNEVTIQF